MASLLFSRLVNGPFGDPGLYIDIKWERRAILFDLGNNGSLPPAMVLKVSDVFISHTHMDHFIGFDRFLRIVLSHPKTIRFYGPEGLIRNIQGKLAGYTWNLTESYPLVMEITEILPDRRLHSRLTASDGFAPQKVETLPFTDEILSEPMVSVFVKILHHKIPSLAFSLNERFHINIINEEMEKRGFSPGPWLRALKEAIWQNRKGGAPLEIPVRNKEGVEEIQKWPIEDLSPIYQITRGQKISYVVDTLYSKENEAKIVSLAKDSTLFYCESPFLDRDADQAAFRHHLTARQAGMLARNAGVHSLTVFHFSPRYAGEEKALYEEAYKTFKNRS